MPHELPRRRSPILVVAGCDRVYNRIQSTSREEGWGVASIKSTPTITFRSTSL
jgi:hypothetical protein